MGRILRCVVAALTALACEAWAQADINLQSLFAGLTQGSEVTLVTPLANGMAEVTSFSPPGRFSAADAAGALPQGQVPGAGSAAVGGSAGVAPAARPVVPSR